MTPFAFTESPSPAELVCRAALPLDTPAILELTRRIWNGHDYIPFVWRDWLADAEGFLAVAEYGSRIAGMGKLTRLAEDEWWLEGLRVHPDFEGRGFATHIHRYLMERWRALGKGAIRLATASKRIAVHRICDKLGFQKVAEFAAFEKPTKLNGNADAFRLIQADELETAFAFATESHLLPLCFSLIDLGWQWANPRLAYLKRYVTAAQAYGWRGNAALVCADEDDEDGIKSWMLRWVACEPQDLAEVLIDFAHFAAQNGCQKAAWIAPLQSPILQALEKAGYQAAWDFSLYVFEYSD
ncbi:MAG: GNAT family N-acetyltransferase [Anaerolineales bacterium]|nr:GNAT family N-acetyltransferase [Anaerolineales bacterium]